MKPAPAASALFLLSLLGASPPDTPDMLPVPGGTFTMGADSGGERDEEPAHPVTVGSFLLDTTEVTNGAYRECVRAGACAAWGAVSVRFGAGPEAGFRGETQPVVGVSFHDAERYWEFRGKRLPREAEWERAARGDDARTYAWGDEAPDASRACFGRKPGAKGATTDPVGSHPLGRGPYGHLDLTGNVWEWTADIYDPMAYQRPGAATGTPGSCEEVKLSLDYLRRNKLQGYTGKNPIPTECERVLRGGAFNYDAHGLRASNRVHHPEGWRILVAGFRCAEDP